MNEAKAKHYSNFQAQSVNWHVVWPNSTAQPAVPGVSWKSLGEWSDSRQKIQYYENATLKSLEISGSHSMNIFNVIHYHTQAEECLPHASTVNE